MAGLSAAGAINTQLEQVQDSIPFLTEATNTPWISTSRTTDAPPASPPKLSVS
jgi:hypothetical protein